MAIAAIAAPVLVSENRIVIVLLPNLPNPGFNVAVLSGTPVNWVDPRDGLGLLHGFNVEVDNNCLLVAAHNHAFQRLLRQRIYFLMRHVGRNINEVARPGLRGVFQMFAPTHAGAPGYDVNNALERSMMVRSGSGIRLDSDRPGPDFLGSDASVIDSGGAGHSRRLRSVLIQRITRMILTPLLFQSIFSLSDIAVDDPSKGERPQPSCFRKKANSCRG